MLSVKEFFKKHRPRLAPRRIPRWAFALRHWELTGRIGQRPPHAPKYAPPWFPLWKRWLLHRAQGAHSKIYEAYLASNRRKTAGAEVAATARSYIGKAMPYTESASRADWLVQKLASLLLADGTDCSGFSTFCYWKNQLPDPNGLLYRWLGWTGTEIENATKHGHVTYDLSKARLGDIWVVGLDPGVHEGVVTGFTTINGRRVPLITQHGAPGVVELPATDDPRQPQRICQTL